MASLRKVAVSGKFAVKIVKWHVEQGQEVMRDTVLASYIKCNEGHSNAVVSERKLKSRFNGKVTKILIKQDEEVLPSVPVIIISEEHCLHTIVMKDMCCECGADLRMDSKIPGKLAEPVAAEIPMVHNIPELKVSLEEAERLARYDERQLLRSRKLALVVDLDQTLIHTTHEDVPRDLPEVFHYQLADYPCEYHTKLRPGAKKFLQTVANLYELHIFTMGSRMYAHTIARYLDPDEKLFAHRIRSRDECLDAFSKSRDLRSLFPCGDHMVCIIDDREDVWDFAPNLITVKPYRFFKGTGDINDPFLNKGVPTPTNAKDESEEAKKNEGPDGDKFDASGKSAKDFAFKDEEENNISKVDEQSKMLSDSDCKEEQDDCKTVDDEKGGVSDPAESGIQDGINDDGQSNGADHPPDLDDYLFYLEEILERVHASFYSTVDAIKAKGGLSRQDPEITRFCTPGTISPDARTIIPSLRKEVLKGTNIVFTGVVPTNIPLKNSTIYRTAVSLGASVTDSIISGSDSGSSAEGSLCTTHLVAARLGTEKAYRASKMRNVKLVGVDWLWCCAQRWEWVDERLFPVTNGSRENGIGTPDTSRKGTPILGEKHKNKGSNGNGSSERDKQLMGRNDNLLESIFPISFNKDELEKMDKEVEEYMLSEEEEDSEDDNGEQQDMLGSVSGSSGRSSASSSSSSSLSMSSRNSNTPSPLESIRKKTKQLNDQLEVVRKKKREMSPGNVAVDVDSPLNISSSSSADSNSSEDDLQFGELLEKQIENS